MLIPSVRLCVCVSCPVLSCLVLSYLVLSCLVLSCLVLSCLVLSCLVLSCLVLSCLVLSCLVLSCDVLSCLKPKCNQLFHVSICLDSKGFNFFLSFFTLQYCSITIPLIPFVYVFAISKIVIDRIIFNMIEYKYQFFAEVY